MTFNLDQVLRFLAALRTVLTQLYRTQEVHLPTTKNERDKFDQKSNLYALIISLDYLERAWVRDSLSVEK